MVAATRFTAEPRNHRTDVAGKIKSSDGERRYRLKFVIPTLKLTRPISRKSQPHIARPPRVTSRAAPRTGIGTLGRDIVASLTRLADVGDAS